MATGSYLSIITLNINGLNAPTKRQRLAEWIQKQGPCICCLQETHLETRDTYKLKVKGWKKYSRLISFRIDWFDLLLIQKSSPAPQFKSINSLALSLLYDSTLTSIHDCWKNHCFDYMDLN